MTFVRNVFVNCPFDKEYRPLLDSLLFTIIALDFEPKLTLQELDSGEARIEKIIKLIKSSKYSVHDLSRSQASRIGEYFRLNMPLELGIDIGCKRFSIGKLKRKRCLILESKSYRHQATISDLSNSDIRIHNNDPIELVRHVRNWLNNECNLSSSGPAHIWRSYNAFNASLFIDLKKKGFSKRDIDKLGTDEFMRMAKIWCKSNS